MVVWTTERRANQVRILTPHKTETRKTMKAKTRIVMIDSAGVSDIHSSDRYFEVSETVDELKAKLNSLTNPTSFIEIEHISDEYLDDISMDSSKITYHKYVINTAHIVRFYSIGTDDVTN